MTFQSVVSQYSDDGEVESFLTQQKLVAEHFLLSLRQ